MLKQTLRAALTQLHSEVELRKWFDPLRLQLIDQSSVDVCYPHAYFAQCLPDDKRQSLERETARLLGEDITLTYRNHTARRAWPVSPPPADLTAASGPLARECSFDTFLTNRKNSQVLDLACKAARSPENPQFFPFVIWGTGTCGKTHLLRAMASEMATVLPFDRLFQGSPDDLRSLEGVDPLALTLAHCRAFFLDDAHQLAGDCRLQAQLADLVDSLLQRSIPVILAFNQDPNRMPLPDRFLSRLKTGTAMSLMQPDLDIRLRFTLAEAQRMALGISRSQAMLIADKSRDMRRLSVVLVRVAALEDRQGRPPSEGELSRLLNNSDLFTSALSADLILDTLCTHFGCSRPELTGNGRKRHLSQARQIAMTLCRDMLSLSYPAIGEIFGGRNHATVMYACKKIQQLQEGDKLMNNLVSTLRNKCLNRTV